MGRDRAYTRPRSAAGAPGTDPSDQSDTADLDLTLALADVSPRGKADPAFATHEAPIGLWADAAWGAWLPPIAMTNLAKHALART